MKSLILYFSNTGNTRSIAEKIYTNTFSNIEELRLTNGILKPLRSNIDNYNTIFIGSPVINNDVCDAIKYLFKEYNFDNKKIIPFISYDKRGYSSLDFLQELSGNIDLANTLAVFWDDLPEEEFKDWLTKIKE